MHQFQGLSHCGSNYSPKCITKTIQFAVSSILFILILSQFLLRIRKQRQINFFVIVSIQMLITLFCNLLHCWLFHIYILYCFQVFVFGLYFTTIVYKIALKLIEKTLQNRKLYWALLHCVFLVFFCANLTVLILRLTNSYSNDSCNQIWYLTLQTLGIALSICMVMGGIHHQKTQKLKVSESYKKHHLKNPMPSMWRWIIINIISQTFGLIQSLIFEFTPQNKCHFSTNETIESIIKLIFALIGYHMGMFATYLFFRQKYKEGLLIKRSSLRKDSLENENESPHIQLVFAKFSQLQ